MIDLKPYIRAYLKNIDEIRAKEKYKWEGFKHFKKTFRIDAEDFGENLYEALKFPKPDNILGTTVRPREDLRKAAKASPEKAREKWKELYDEKKPLSERVAAFQTWHSNMLVALTNDIRRVQSQDAHAISVYLALRYPDKYFIYSSRQFRYFAKVAGFQYKPKAGFEMMREFVPMFEQTREQLAADEELISEYKAWLKENGFKDKGLNILTQDFIFAVNRHIDFTRIDNKDNEAYKAVKASCLSAEIIGNASEPSEKGKPSFSPVEVDYDARNRRIIELGAKGEKWVCQYEQTLLLDKGRADLAKRVENVSVTRGDGLGYDVLSFNDDGTEKHIEVKTTAGAYSRQFYVTRNELEYSRQHPDTFFLYRVYDYEDGGDGMPRTARIKIIRGSLEPLCTCPVTFSVKL